MPFWTLPIARRKKGKADLAKESHAGHRLNTRRESLSPVGRTDSDSDQERSRLRDRSRDCSRDRGVPLVGRHDIVEQVVEQLALVDQRIHQAFASGPRELARQCPNLPDGFITGKR